MTQYPDHLAIARRLLEQQAEINTLRERAEKAEATLRVARFTAEHWRNAMMMSENTRIAAHPCAMILTALDGETDPVECGIDDWAQDAFRVIVAGGSAEVASAQSEFPLPIRPDGTHYYVSTYCVDGQHAACRLTCKCCSQPCQCATCGHNAPTPVGTSAAPANELAASVGESYRDRLLAKYPVTLEDLNWEPDPSSPPNMEDCPQCVDPNPPYPWICPGHPAVAGPATGREEQS